MMYADDECNQCLSYAHIRQDSHTWKCIICGLIEDTIFLSPHEPIVWVRYELLCGHQTHIRCFRTWCKQHDISCASCGSLSEYRNIE